MRKYGRYVLLGLGELYIIYLYVILFLLNLVNLMEMIIQDW